MGLWGDRVLPHIIDRACAMDEMLPLRERACAGLNGTVLELGFGSGLNCSLYPEAVTDVLAVEPSDTAWRMSADRRATASAPVARAGLDAQGIELDDDSVDSVLITFTLCTIPDAEAALTEVARVLKPAGSVHIAEHGQSPDGGVAAWQRRLDPIQQRLFGGCHLTRQPINLLEASGFTSTDIEAGYVNGFAVARPWSYGYSGTAQR